MAFHEIIGHGFNSIKSCGLLRVICSTGKKMRIWALNRASIFLLFLNGHDKM
jgi:hypothetical protein